MQAQKVIKDQEKAAEKEKADFWRMQQKEMEEMNQQREELKRNSDGEVEDDFW